MQTVSQMSILTQLRQPSQLSGDRSRELILGQIKQICKSQLSQTLRERESVNTTKSKMRIIIMQTVSQMSILTQLRQPSQLTGNCARELIVVQKKSLKVCQRTSLSGNRASESILPQIKVICRVNIEWRERECQYHKERRRYKANCLSNVHTYLPN